MIKQAQGKLTALKQLKAAYLQQMFPQAGQATPRIRFAGFSEPWEQLKLGDVLDSMYNGQTPSRSGPKNWKGEINWLTSGELNRGTVTSTIEKITVQGQKDANLKLIPSGTFVMAITGLEAAGTRGNCAILGIETTLNQSCMALFPKKEKLDSIFLFYWYRKVGEEYGLGYTQGTKQQSYNAEIIKLLPITLPKIKEQVAIGNFFRNLDGIIAVHQRKLDSLKKLKKLYLQKIFVNEISQDFENPTNTIITDGQRQPNTPHLRFKGFVDPWEQRKLGEVVELNPRSTLPNTFEYVDLESVVGTSLISQRTENADTAPSRAQRLAQRGDVFYQTVRPYQMNNYLFDLPFDNFVFSTGYAQLRPKCDSYFLLNRLQEKRFVADVLDKSTGTSYPAINSGDLMQVKIGVAPTNEEQTAIGNFFRALDELIKQYS